MAQWYQVYASALGLQLSSPWTILGLFYLQSPLWSTFPQEHAATRPVTVHSHFESQFSIYIPFEHGNPSDLGFQIRFPFPRPFART